VLVYVAGPYRGKSRFRVIRLFQVLRNIWRAGRVAKQLWAKGFVAICPHLNTFLMDDVCPQERFLEGDLEILRHCDILVTTSGWTQSEGSRREVEFAKQNNIPVGHGLDIGFRTNPNHWAEGMRRFVERCKREYGSSDRGHRP